MSTVTLLFGAMNVVVAEGQTLSCPQFIDHEIASKDVPTGGGADFVADWTAYWIASNGLGHYLGTGAQGYPSWDGDPVDVEQQWVWHDPEVTFECIRDMSAKPTISVYLQQGDGGGWVEPLPTFSFNPGDGGGDPFGGGGDGLGGGGDGFDGGGGGGGFFPPELIPCGCDYGEDCLPY